jgi:hypothetical protein
MSSHWQDLMCPYCLDTQGGHTATCIWPDKLAKYEARKAAGEDPVVPDGIDVVMSVDELVDYLAAGEQDDTK